MSAMKSLADRLAAMRLWRIAEVAEPAVRYSDGLQRWSGDDHVDCFSNWFLGHLVKHLCLVWLPLIEPTFAPI
jgi:hypothetical protein